MKTARKALLIALCAVLLVAASVMGTLAYLTSTTEVVTNTFSVGKVVITLDEAPVDAEGKETAGTRVTANEYHLIPGSSYDKDPTVHVDADSEDAWLFVKVENGISAIETGTTIAQQMADKGWTLVEGQTNVYAYKEIVKASGDYVVFENFQISGEADVASYTDASIKITAYAIQAENFDTAAQAWEAAPASWN